MKNQKLVVLSGIVILIAAFFAGAQLYKSYQASKITFMAQENAEIFVRPHSPTMGPDNAPVYLVEFLDPECESCRRFYPIVKNIMKEYEGKIKLIVRYVPFHRNSKQAIAILEAAKKQGKFWEAIHVLFKYQPQWADHHNPQPHRVWEFLPEAGVNLEKIRSDMLDPKIIDVITQDLKDAQSLSVRGTPTFFVNGKPLAGFGEHYLRQAINSELNK